MSRKLLAVYTRLLALPARSFLLFGPRGTGKTTWLRQQLPDARWYDLLRSREYVRLMRDPEILRREVEALPRGSWVVVDEVQRLPALLDEVHGLIAAHGQRYRFALSGSSARKLRRLDVNLLAGRAVRRTFLPLTWSELGEDVAVDEVLRHGLLPGVRSDSEHAVDLLEAYVGTYLQEEIRQEALVKDLDSFARFLEVAALVNGEVVNVASIARDAGVARPTVQRYFDTLVDTLIGFRLPAWRPRLKVREVAHPKFYLFDTGVVRALQQRLRDPIEAADRGHLLETWVLHELRAALAIQNLGGELSYWRTPDKSEVDFVWTRGRTAVGIEVKAATEWRADHGAPLRAMLAQGLVGRAYGVHLGSAAQRAGGIEVLPVRDFLRELHAGRVLRAR